MIWLSLRDSMVLWTLAIAGTATVFYAVHGRIGVPTSSAFELTLVWLYFSLILGRCLLLSLNANEMRARLADSGRKLAVSLDQVQRLASHDELTGTLNRRSLMAALKRERSRAECSGVPFSIAMIDLDYFNHAGGDGADSRCRCGKKLGFDCPGFVDHPVGRHHQPPQGRKHRTADAPRGPGAVPRKRRRPQYRHRESIMIGSTWQRITEA